MTPKHNIELLPLRRRPFHLIYLTIKSEINAGIEAVGGRGDLGGNQAIRVQICDVFLSMFDRQTLSLLPVWAKDQSENCPHHQHPASCKLLVYLRNFIYTPCLLTYIDIYFKIICIINFVPDQVFSALPSEDE